MKTTAFFLRFGRFAAAAALAPGALALTAYDEALSGDMSNSGASPSLASPLAAGSNEILGASGYDGDVLQLDRDYLTFTVPAGTVWTQFNVLDGTRHGGGVAFVGLQSGSQVTVDPDGGSAAGLLGWHHYAGSDIGNDILVNMSFPTFGSSGFSIPLPAGDYSLWIQELQDGVFPYHFEIVLAAVPTPDGGSSLIALGTALALISTVGSRRLFSRQQKLKKRDYSLSPARRW